MLDLRPRGMTTIDLMHQERKETWRPWGSTYRLPGYPPGPERERFAASLKEAEQIARSIKSKEEALTLLRALIPESAERWEGAKIGHLKAAVQNSLVERWFPRVFINEKEG